MKTFANGFVLRRTFTPYLSLASILAFITLMMAVLSVKMHSWEPLYASSVFWTFFLVLLLVGTRYRIYFRNGNITELAYGKPPTTISVNEISAVKQESSSARELIAFNRPQSRITIIGNGKSIDVSLRHFHDRDVNELLLLIKASRSDLDISIRETS
jgi:hypothetical protein